MLYLKTNLKTCATIMFIEYQMVQNKPLELCYVHGCLDSLESCFDLVIQQIMICLRITFSNCTTYQLYRVCQDQPNKKFC